jgi:hypothetical protein
VAPESTSQHFIGSPADDVTRKKTRKIQRKTAVAAASVSVEVRWRVRICNVVSGVLAELLQLISQRHAHHETAWLRHRNRDREEGVRRKVSHSNESWEVA